MKKGLGIIETAVCMLLGLAAVNSCASDYYFVNTDYSDCRGRVSRTVSYEDSSMTAGFTDAGWSAGMLSEDAQEANEARTVPERDFKYIAKKIAALGHDDSLALFFSAFGITEDFERKQGWFVTEYRYSATFPQCDLPAAPIQDYMDEQDRNIWLRGEGMNPALSGYELMYRLDEINDDFLEWYNYSYFSYNCEIFSKYMGTPLADMLCRAKDDIFDKMFSSAEYLDMIDARIFSEKVDEYFHGTDYREIYEANKAELDSIFNIGQDRVDRYFGQYLYFSVTMPGRLVATDAKIHDNNSAMWYVYPIRMLDGPLEIHAVSRKVNIWACAVTALAVAAAVFVFCTFLIRRKSR